MGQRRTSHLYRCRLMENQLSLLMNLRQPIWYHLCGTLCVVLREHLCASQPSIAMTKHLLSLNNLKGVSFTGTQDFRTYARLGLWWSRTAQQKLHYSTWAAENHEEARHPVAFKTMPYLPLTQPNTLEPSSQNVSLWVSFHVQTMTATYIWLLQINHQTLQGLWLSQNLG